MPAPKKGKTSSPAVKVVSPKVEKANQTNVFDDIANRFKNFDRENNIHMIIGIVLLLIGLYLLRSWIVGLIFLIIGILFVTGYFEKK